MSCLIVYGVNGDLKKRSIYGQFTSVNLGNQQLVRKIAERRSKMQKSITLKEGDGSP